MKKSISETKCLKKLQHEIILHTHTNCITYQMSSQCKVHALWPSVGVDITFIRTNRARQGRLYYIAWESHQPGFTFFELRICISKQIKQTYLLIPTLPAKFSTGFSVLWIRKAKNLISHRNCRVEAQGTERYLDIDGYWQCPGMFSLSWAPKCE